ncbi:putative transposase [Nakamurella panacisegetis]|uniref:Putative transposase n=1 Tax=Nakamurella panacisegetis TaxID=1090615 RepID=A0A1H0RF71_9ACTN|nr:putative transposase [Nakamurella panacisegetis]
MIISYIDQHKAEYGVGTICRVLTEHGCKIASSTYYDRTHQQPSARAVRDEALSAQVSAVHAENYGVYGARKVWLTLNREGTAVARCTVERLMRRLGLVGARRGKVKRTTIADPQAQRASDLVDRHFDPEAPDRLWVADFTYVSTWSGWVYVAFVIDAYSRRIVGWRSATTMTAQLVLDAIEHAIWTRQREGVQDLSGLIHHNDRGSQYTSVAFTERLADAGIDASVGRTGDSFDNALAETINGLYKTELIKPRGPGGPSSRSKSPPWNGSTGSTTAACTSTTATSHRSNSSRPTTLKSEPSKPLRSQTRRCPDMPGWFRIPSARCWAAGPPTLR